MMGMKKIMLSVVVGFAAALCGGAPKVETGVAFGEAKPVAETDLHAMALDLDGKFLYGGAGDFFYVFDISDPLAPRKLGEVRGIGGARQLVVRKGLAYVTTREYGLWIVDATDPAHPRIRSRFDTCELATGVDVAGDVCFCGQRQNGVEFIDVSDPDRPRHIAMRKTGESQSVKYRDGWLYSGEWGGGHVTVFDAHDMSAIRQVNLIDLHGYGDGLWVQGKYLYAARGHHSLHRTVTGGVVTDEMKRFGGPAVGGGMGHGLDIFDASDPANPKRVGEVDYPPFYARGLDMWTPRTSGDLLVAAQTHNGVFAVDISDKTAPKVLDRWTVPTAKRAGMPSECVGSVAIGDGVVYAAVNGEGFFAIPCARAKREAFDCGVLPKNASFREDYPADRQAWHVWKPHDVGQCRAVAVKGDVVFAACGDAGLYALQVTKDGFRELGKLPGHESVYDVSIGGDRVFAAEGMDGVGVYDLTAGPAAFREIGRLPRIAWYKSIALNVWNPADGWLVASDRHGVDFFDIRDFPKMTHKLFVSGAPGWDRYLADRAVGDGRYVAYNQANTSVKWIDLKAGGKPKVSVETKVNRISLVCSLCAFEDDTKLIASTGGGFHLLEPNEGDPADGGKWPKIGLPPAFPGDKHGGYMTGIPRADGKRLVLTNRINRRAALYDLTDMKKPKLVAAWKFSGNPDIAAFVGGKVIIPCGYEGLLLQR